MAPSSSNGHVPVALEALTLAVSAQVPVLLWGSPGTGKTSALMALGDALGWLDERGSVPSWAPHVLVERSAA